MFGGILPGHILTATASPYGFSVALQRGNAIARGNEIAIKLKQKYNILEPD